MTSHVPVPLTSFIGRASEIANVKSLLKTTRLLTILGPGGCGKTRLALRVAGDLQREFADGVWFVDLAGLTDANFIPQTLAATLGLRETPGTPVTETLFQVLRSKALLLVFDNCEHLVDACAIFVERLLQYCPLVQGLATSREVLKLSGETIWHLPPLSIPALDPLPSLEDLMQYEAVQLFLERATHLLPTFRVEQEDAAMLAQICVRLDGLPLAIELAVTRIQVLSLEQIAARLDQRFALLTTGIRTALPRHRTLRAVIDWSYGLLSPRERRLFCRLSVFAGSWTLEAAEAICADEAADEQGADEAAVRKEAVLDVLSSLVDKSLVVVGREADIRYSFLESLSHYAREQLAHEADPAHLRQRHALYFAQWAEKAEPHLQTAARPRWLRQLKQEYDNLRAALVWSLAGPEDLSLAQRLGVSLWCFWMHYGLWSEARGWLEQMKRSPVQASPSLLTLRLLHVLGWLAFLQGEDALVHRLMEEGIQLAQRMQTTELLGSYLILSSQLAYKEGRQDEAYALAQQSVALLRSCGEQHWAAGAALVYFGAMVHAHDPLHATRLYEESCALLREVGDPWVLALALRHLGDAAFHDGAYVPALSHYQESVLLYRDADDLWSFALSLEHMAGALGLCGNWERAALLFGAAEALRNRMTGVTISPSHIRSEQSIAYLRQRLDQEVFARRWSAGRQMTLPEVVTEVQAISPSTPRLSVTGSAAALVQERDQQDCSLRLLALGATQVYRGEHLLEAADWTFTRPRELLFYLLCYAPSSKGEIGLALWPNASPAQLRSSFHSALYHLRRALGCADWLRYEHQRYVFDRTAASFWFDVEVFEAHLASAQLSWGRSQEEALLHYQQAITLYRGDFLQDCDEGDWFAPRRQALRQSYLNALMSVGRILFTRQQYAQAAQVYRQLIAAEPFFEEAHRELMRCTAREGDRIQAVRHFQQLHELLSDELGAAPASETTALAIQLRRGERI